MSDSGDETEPALAHERCMLLTRDMLLLVRDGTAVVRMPRIEGAQEQFIGMAPEAAIRFGAALMRAGQRLAPGVTLEAVEAAPRRQLKPVGGEIVA